MIGTGLNAERMLFLKAMVVVPKKRAEEYTIQNILTNRKAYLLFEHLNIIIATLSLQINKNINNKMFVTIITMINIMRFCYIPTRHFVRKDLNSLLGGKKSEMLHI